MTDSSMRDLERKARDGTDADRERYVGALHRSGVFMPMDLRELAKIPKASPFIGVSTTWYAGNRVGMLEAYLGDRAAVLASEDEGDYQGTTFAFLKIAPGRYAIWRDSFGSCSGCDEVEGMDLTQGLEHIRGTLQEGNTKQFPSVALAVAYLETVVGYGANADGDYYWTLAPLAFLEAVRKHSSSNREEESTP